MTSRDGSNPVSSSRPSCVACGVSHTTRSRTLHGKGYRVYRNGAAGPEAPWYGQLAKGESVETFLNEVAVVSTCSNAWERGNSSWASK